jgi:hypothetical protein
VLQDRLEQSGAEDFAGVDGHGDAPSSPLVPELDVGSSLDDHDPAEPLQRADELATGDAW